MPKNELKNGAKSATVQAVVAPIKAICDPALKVCYPPLADHWRRKYAEPHKNHAHKVLIFDLVLATILSALVVFWIFGRQFLPIWETPALVNVELGGPVELISGQEHEFTIRFTNESESELGCTQLRVNLPQDTYISSQLPTLDENHTSCVVDTSTLGELEADEAKRDILVFPQATLQPGETSVVKVRATTYGATGSLKEARAVLSYWEEGELEPTRISLRQEWAVADSIVELEGESPGDIVRGRTHATTFSYENKSDSAIEGTRMEISVPRDFVVTGYSDVPGPGRKWALGVLTPNESGSITVYGYFRSTGEAAPTFLASVFGDIAGESTLIESIRHNADPRSNGLSLSVMPTNFGSRQFVRPGDEVELIVSYSNNSGQEISQAVITMNIDGDYLSGEPTIAKWDRFSDPGLSSIKPGDSGTLVSRITIADPITPEMLGGVPYPELFVSVSGEYPIEGDLRPVRIDTPVTHLPITASFDIGAITAYYTEAGDQLGTGPLPPKVGETTKYRIVIAPTITTSSIKDLTIEARLPEGVVWTGRTSVSAGGALDYLPSQRKVRWLVESLPAWTGIDGPPVIATFEVAVTPAEDAAGTVQTLVSAISAHGTDSVTGLGLGATNEDLTTEIAEDSGVVTE